MQSIWSICIGKLSGLVFYAHMSLFLICIWLFYEEYSQSASVSRALAHVLIVVCLLAFYEGIRLYLLQKIPVKLQFIMLYPFGGLTNIDRTLSFEMAQTEEAKQHLIQFACIPPILLAGLAFTLFICRHLLPYPEYTQLFMLLAALLAILLLLPVSPYPGGKLFQHFCDSQKWIPSITPFLAKVFALLLLCVFVSQAQSVALYIVAVVYAALAVDQHIFERTRLTARHYSASEAMLPLNALIRFPQAESTRNALEQSLKSYQSFFPVMLHERVVGFVERNSLIQPEQIDGSEPRVSDVMREELHCVYESESLATVMNMFRETYCPILFVINRDKKYLGMLAKDKVVEYLVVKGIDTTLNVESDREM